MDEWSKGMRGSQIPAFGDWEYVNELPITQYFECARQAGLIRYSSSSGECDHFHQPDDLYSVSHLHNHKLRPPSTAPPRPKPVGKGREKRGASHVKDGGGGRKQAGKIFDVTVTEVPHQPAAIKRHPPAVKQQQQQHQYQYDAGLRGQPRRAPKAVDEDLYKIPPELLKRKRRLGFISRCLVPPCAV